MIAELVYFVCAVASVGCAVLLVRAYRRNHTPLLLWSSWCFILLALNNVLLVVDLALITGTDLSAWRAASALAGLAVLLFGLILDAERRGT